MGSGTGPWGSVKLEARARVVEQRATSSNVRAGDEEMLEAIFAAALILPGRYSMFASGSLRRPRDLHLDF